MQKRTLEDTGFIYLIYKEREREREAGRQADRQTKRDRDRETDRQRDRQRQTDRQRHRDRETGRVSLLCISLQEPACSYNYDKVCCTLGTFVDVFR